MPVKYAYELGMNSMLRAVQIDGKDKFFSSDSITIGAGAGLLGCPSFATRDIVSDCLAYVDRIASADEVQDDYRVILIIYMLNMLGLRIDQRVVAVVTGISDWEHQLEQLLCICKYYPARVWRYLLSSLIPEARIIKDLSARINMQQGVTSGSYRPAEIIFDNDFFRTFGHNCYQPLFISLDQDLRAKLLSERPPKICYIQPNSDSVASVFYSFSGNSYLVHSAIKTLGHKFVAFNSESIQPCLRSYPRDPYISHTYASLRIFSEGSMQYAYAKLMRHTGRWSTYSLKRRTERQQLANSDSIQDYDKSDLAEFHGLILNLTGSSFTKIVLVHSRNSLFYGDENLRNSDLHNYGPALRYLKQKGLTPILFSDQQHITEEIKNLIIHYPGSGHKTKRNDYLLCKYAGLLLGNPSGPMGIGDLFNYGSIGIDWWPYGIWPSNSTIVVPRPVRDCSSGKYMSIDDFSRQFPDQSDRLTPPARYQVLKASKDDILEACITHFETSSLVDLQSVSESGTGMIPRSIAERYGFY